MTPRAGAPGYVLLQALVLSLLVAVIADLLLHVALARRVAQARRQTSLQGRAFVEASYSRAASCLAAMNVANCAVPSGSCDAACGVKCSQVFGSYNLTLSAGSAPPATHAMRVALANSSGQCQIQASCLDCSGGTVTP